MITYPFAPVGYVGVYRTLKACKYLREFGWEPIVLTSTPSNKAFTDDKLIKDIPENMEVYRTYDFDPLNLRTKNKNSTQAKATNNGEKESIPIPPRSNGNGFVSRIKKGILNGIKAMCVPDNHIFWVPFAVLRGVKILLTHKIDIIYCTSPPHSSHVAAYILSKMFRKKYIADFRDPWGSASYRKYYGAFYNKTNVTNLVEDFMVNKVMYRASRVITISKGMSEEYLDIYGRFGTEKFAYINNGYDSEDFGACDTSVHEGNEGLLLVHNGSIYGKNGDDFFHGVKLLLDEHQELIGKLKIIFTGNVEPHYTELVNDLGLRECVEFTGFITHKDALSYLMSSDILLILLGTALFEKFTVPAKTFEYIFTRKPILAMTTEGDLSDIVRECGLGVVIKPGDRKEVARSIYDIYRRKVSGKPLCKPNNEYIKQFERRALTGRLAEVMDNVLLDQSGPVLSVSKPH